MDRQQLLQKKHWIFDMDGTLTLAIHDFDAIRRQLGLPTGKPILEKLAELPKQEARQLHQRLDMIELAIAQQSTAATGAAKLLQTLSAQGRQLGILTRNNLLNIHATLDAAGLSRYFQHETLISRHCAPPKPDPAGIQRLLSLWGAQAGDAVMVGDHLFDLDTGRAAGTAVVYVDHTAEFPYRERADLCIRTLDELCPD
jgi:HAD superfamily hydrolase (TIGR01509 family)